MAIRKIFKKVLERLIELTDDDGEDANIAHLRHPHVPSRSTSAEVGHDRLKDVLTKSGIVQMGQVQLLSLELIKEHFKDNWDDVKGRIQGIAQHVIDQHLTDEDFYTEYGELTFLLVYSHIDKQAARLKNAIIGQDIAHHLVGTDLADTFVRSQTVVSFTETDLELEENPTIEGIAQIVEQMAVSEQGNEGGEAQTSLGWHYEKLDPGFFDTILSRMQYSFIPLWNVSRGVISNYIFVPTLLEKGEIVQGYDILPDAKKVMQVAEMDIFTLNLALPHLEQMVKESGRYLITLPVHYLTLSSSVTRNRFLETCRDIPEQALRYLVFEVHGVPDGIVTSTLLNVLQYLHKYSRAIIVRLAAAHQAIPEVSGSSALHAIGIDYAEAGLDDQTELEAFEDLASAAEDLKYKSYLVNAPTLAAISSAVSAGITYVSGTAVLHPLPAPEGVRKFGVLDLYHDISTDFLAHPGDIQQ